MDYKALYEQQLAENKKLKEYQKDIVKELKEEYEAAEAALAIVKEENETNKKNLQKFMNQAKLWETTAKNIEEKKTEIEEEMKYSTLLTGETIQLVFQDENPILADADEFCQKVAEKYREGVSQYLYDKMCETIADDIDIEEEMKILAR